MSTRSSLAYGKAFHLYTDLMDDGEDEDSVYLDITDPCGHHRSIKIPIDIWETIRHSGGARLDLVKATDAELLEKASKAVDERLAEYKSEKLKRVKVWIAFGGSLVLGDIKWSRKRQVANALNYYRGERARQAAIADKIAAHKAYSKR